MKSLVICDDLEETELAYMAGIVDGEGSIGAYLIEGTLKARVLVTMTALELLQEIQSRFGGCLNDGEKKMKSRKACYNLSWQGVQGQQLLRLLFPYLRLKKEQAAIFIALPIGHRGYHISQEIKLQQAIACVQLKELNTRGVPQEPKC